MAISPQENVISSFFSHAETLAYRLPSTKYLLAN